MTWSICDYNIVRQAIIDEDKKELLQRRELDVFRKLVGNDDAFSDLQKILDIYKKIESIKGNGP